MNRAGETRDNLFAKAGFSQPSMKVMAGMALFVALIGAFAVQSFALATDTASFEYGKQAVQLEPDDGVQNQEDQTETVFVHVDGSVEHPGLYQLEKGARIDDAIKAAGGLTEGACLDAINLATPLVDSMKVHVPSDDELRGLPEEGSYAQGSPVATARLVSINTASSSQLQELPGIGEATASRIVAYRTTKGPFTCIEDLLFVSGIGEKKLAAIQDLITI